jgi:Cu2+-exporting ATPase
MNAAAALHARWSTGTRDHALFAVEGMHCAGCARGIEAAVKALPDIEAVSVNVASARVSVDWRGGGPTTLQKILDAVARAGFTPVPLAGREAATRYAEERRAALKRLGLASLGMMQAMMYLAALYGASDIDAAMTQLMRIAGMVIVTPVLFYSGAPFLEGAWRDLHNRRLGMDVPVALALLLAWLPSVVNTLRGSGDVYFDSVGMFVFFLSVGRFVEMSVRHRGLSTAEALARSLPSQVVRLARDGSREKIAATDLLPGDRFLVPKGAVVAVDAQIPADAPAGTHAALDESLVSGESITVRREPGERIRGGSVNVGAPLTLVASATVAGSTLASLVTLAARAHAARPRIARAADRAASWFTSVILLLAVVTGALWWPHDRAHAFEAVLAVLVVTCPCALSLATPAALAAATTRLARLGLLVTRADAIERLARIDSVLVDKTGTLTQPVTGIVDVRLLGSRDRDSVLAIAAALERASAHPLAAAFAPHDDARREVAAVHEFAGEGIEGMVDGELWRLGRASFVAAVGGPGGIAVFTADGAADATLYLGGRAGIAAAIEIGAPLRPEARATIRALRERGLAITLASGDSERAVRQAARALDLQSVHSRLTPDDKIWLANQLRECGHRCFAIGDGINDGPVLAAAHVSCAMGQGSAVAHSAADLLLVRDDLAVLPRAIDAARAALRVMRQNLVWALGYNIAAVPLAALGFVPPWLAALGMSLSSLGVVLNARRLARTEAA